jgi:hypothetical protein
MFVLVTEEKLQTRLNILHSAAYESGQSSEAKSSTEREGFVLFICSWNVKLSA